MSKNVVFLNNDRCGTLFVCRRLNDTEYVFLMINIHELCSLCIITYDLSNQIAIELLILSIIIYLLPKIYILKRICVMYWFLVAVDNYMRVLPLPLPQLIN